MSTPISNQALVELAEKYGTPLYVYHFNTIQTQYNKLKTAFEGTNAKFFYACKALTNINVLKYLLSLGANVDCSSINEAKLALKAGFPPKRVLYTSNGIAFDEIQEAKELGLNINIDSLSNLQKFGEAYGSDYPVGLRLRPNIMAGGNLKISTGHENSKFGIPVDQLDDILEVVNTYDIRVVDLHIHTGSEIKDVEVFVKGIEILFDLLPNFPHVKIIDLGGGFKVPYKKDEQGTDIPLLAKEVFTSIKNHPNAVGRSLEVWFEPGKFLVSECGTLLTSVNVMKKTKATTFVAVNSGFNHLIRPMFYDAYHQIDNISNENGDIKNYTIVGNICETDTFAWERPIAETNEGDILAFRNAGAYGFEMASNFNSRYKPAEVMVLDGKDYLIRERDVFEDLLRKQIEVL